MNLHTAYKELDGRPPRVTASLIIIEALVVVSVSYVLVGLFA